MVGNPYTIFVQEVFRDRFSEEEGKGREEGKGGVCLYAMSPTRSDSAEVSRPD